VTDEPPAAEYRCPGERYAVSRAVHLGRLTRFYPGCRACPRREETGTLSPRRRRQLAEAPSRRPAAVGGKASHGTALEETLSAARCGGVAIDDFPPSAARELAAAFGFFLSEACRARHDRHGAEAAPPAVVLAGDGRPTTAEQVAAAGFGLRWAGCRVIDIGSVTADCAAFTLAHRHLDGGMLVGNPTRRKHMVGVKLWSAGGRPLGGGGAAKLAEHVPRVADRSGRRFAALGRLDATSPYLARFKPWYRGLRPLVFLLQSASAPFARFVERLTEATACRVVNTAFSPGRLAELLAFHGAEFALWADGDGALGELFDERGRSIAPQRLGELLGALESPTGVGSYTSDALGRLTLLLAALGRGGRRLSELLDAVRPAG
jgi:hypothetical protein